MKAGAAVDLATCSAADWKPLPVPPDLLGESPVWHPHEQVLYWCDIPGQRLHRWDPQRAVHHTWPLDSEPGCLAPLAGGGLLLALRRGLVRFNPGDGTSLDLLAPPYDTGQQRFNDGKVDPHGHLWVGTLHEPRDRPAAALYRLGPHGLEVVGTDCTVSNGLAWSPDGRAAYWADTWAHVIYAIDLDPAGRPTGARRPWRRFDHRDPTQAQPYGGRPDGAAVDREGHYWVAMFEGRQLLRLSPDGRTVQRLPLPVCCPTMPCFGGVDGRTLYLTTARYNRSPEELAAHPLSGHVLQLRVEVPGCPIPLLNPDTLPASS